MYDVESHIEARWESLREEANDLNLWRPSTDHTHAMSWDAFWQVIPPRPDLKEPRDSARNRAFLGLDKTLPAPPEYYPGHDLAYLDEVRS